jgi:DNA polymerase III alpha subunit (gram-positive type)
MRVAFVLAALRCLRLLPGSVQLSAMQEIYISTDVETDGPIPGPHSMLSFGSAAYLADKTLVSTFEANLETLPEAQGHPQTMEWWATQPEAWQACRANLQTPEDAMQKYLAWLKSLPGKPVFVAYPVAFDFMFVYWYLIRFTGESPFSHSALDIKTLAMALLKKGYRDSAKRNMPKRWFDKLPHTHVALDDAIGQGALFCNMLKEIQAQ